MGASQSTRKITVQNDEANIIQVSELVVDRIKKASDGQTGSSSSQGQSSPKVNTPVRTVSQPVSLDMEGQVASTYPYYFGPPHTALQALQEKEKELRENDKYWTSKVKNLEEHHTKTSKNMEAQFVTAMQDVEKQLPRLGIHRTEMPCKERREQIIDCYKKNPSEALLCAKEVSDFAACIDHERRSA